MKQYWMYNKHPRKGKPPWNKGKTGLQVAWNKGKKIPQMSGEHHHWWKGGLTTENWKIRKSLEYKQWRHKVFERDGYQCVVGGKAHGNNLQADHIKPFSTFPAERFDVDNGRTLCKECHKKTDTYGWKSINAKK